MSVVPYHGVNVLTGIKSARLIEDAQEYANLYPLPNFRKDEQWKVFLESLLDSLRKGA